MKAITFAAQTSEFVKKLYCLALISIVISSCSRETYPSQSDSDLLEKHAEHRPRLDMSRETFDPKKTKP